MKKAAVGFRVHSGWSAMVAVSLERGEPIVLRRQRPRFVETFSYTFRQPYHTAEKMDFLDAEKFIADAQTEAERLAHQALQSIQIDLRGQGYRLDRSCLLLAAGRPLPGLENIVKSHALIHTADGELFRESLRAASKRCCLRVECVKERELLKRCAEAFSSRPATLLRHATELGRPFGAPWSQDEKYATLAAWLALSISGNSGLTTQSAKRA
jgi:hypothetical protein